MIKRIGRRNYTPWTPEEKTLVLEHFHRYLVEEMLPGKSACEELIRTAPPLRRRSWTNIKDFIRNHLKIVRSLFMNYF